MTLLVVMSDALYYLLVDALSAAKQGSKLVYNCVGSGSLGLIFAQDTH